MTWTDYSRPSENWRHKWIRYAGTFLITSIDSGTWKNNAKKREATMKDHELKSIGIVLAAIVLSISGCDSLRFAPSESQKQNVTLH